jgi:hypothetical protein
MGLMSNRKLSLALLLLGAYGCSSSSTPADAGKDAGKPDGGDAATSDAGDSATDTASDSTPAPADASDAATDASDASSDAIVLTPAQARGKYLVNNVIACPDCHTPHKADGSPDLTKFLAGDPGFVTLPNGDKLGSRNLTNDATGLKNLTDAEVKDLFLNGKRTAAVGGFLNPTMPYYVLHNMTSGDADAIVAYLRTVPGVVSMIPQRAVSFDVPAAANPLDTNKIPLPIAAAANIDSALRGRYLAAEVGLCVECHTQHQMAADVLNTSKIFAGGEDFTALFATSLMIHPVSLNLTSDATTGLGTWAASDIVTVLKQGKSKDGTGICPPMPAGPMGAYGGLTDSDAEDIANYIKSLPPIVNAIVDMCVFPPAGPADGGTDALSSDASDAVSSDASGN